MSARIRRILGSALADRPEALRAYQKDPLVHQQLEAMTRTLAVVESAMRRHGVADDVAERVLTESITVPVDRYAEERKRQFEVMQKLAVVWNVPPEILFPGGVLQAAED